MCVCYEFTNNITAKKIIDKHPSLKKARQKKGINSVLSNQSKKSSKTRASCKFLAHLLFALKLVDFNEYLKKSLFYYEGFIFLIYQKSLKRTFHTRFFTTK